MKNRDLAIALEVRKAMAAKKVKDPKPNLETMEELESVGLEDAGDLEINLEIPEELEDDGIEELDFAPEGPTTIETVMSRFKKGRMMPKPPSIDEE